MCFDTVWFPEIIQKNNVGLKPVRQQENSLASFVF